MPCYSRIRTKMNNAETIAAALAALGYTVKKTDHSVVGEKEKGNYTIAFTRSNTTDVFQASGDTGNLAAIGRKYAEVGVRSWASRRGYNVTENDGVNMTLVNRRA